MEQSKIIDTLDMYHAPPSLIPARPRVGKWWKQNFWCGVLLGIISMQIFLIVVWIFRLQRFKTKVYIDIENNNTSSILTKQLCLLKITWPKKVIPTKSYSLAILHLHHTNYLNYAQPRWQAKQLFHTLTFSKLFQSSRNTWAWAMDIAL